MKDRYSPNRPSFVAGLFWSSLVLIILACQMPFNFAASTPTSPPSPALPMPTVTSTPTLARSVTLTASAVSNEVKEPTSIILPTDTTILTSMPTATQIANPATDAARVEEIMSGDAAYFTLAPMVAEMMLTDAQGRRIGYDLASGEEVNEFFDSESNFSVYLRNLDEDQSEIFLMPLQAWGTTITLTITGVQTGQYRLLTTFSGGINDDIHHTFINTGTITAGEVKTKTFDIPQAIIEFSAPPEVTIGPDVLVNVGERITFAGSFIDINSTDTHQIGWDFGDGATATGTLTPTHTFINEGVFTVTLTVTDSYGFAVDDSLQVTVVNTMAFQETDGQVVMEAEHFAENVSRSDRAWLTQTVLADYVGGSYMSAVPDTDLQFTTTYTATSPRLSYTINFATTGIYYVWLRGYAPNRAGDSVYLGLNEQYASTILTGFVPGEWTWANTTPYGPAMVEIVKPGLHTLHLWQHEDGLRLDRIVLTSNSSYNPSGDGPPESEIR